MHPRANRIRKGGALCVVDFLYAITNKLHPADGLGPMILDLFGRRFVDNFFAHDSPPTMVVEFARYSQPLIQNTTAPNAPVLGRRRFLLTGKTQ